MQAKHTILYAGGNIVPPNKMVSASTSEKYERERNRAAELEIQSHNPAHFTLGRGQRNIESSITQPHNHSHSTFYIGKRNEEQGFLGHGKHGSGQDPVETKGWHFTY